MRIFQRMFRHIIKKEINKRAVIAVVATVCVLSVGVGSVIAYFSSISGPVVNTFTVGEVKINLTETTGDTYQLIPGAAVEKNPVVTVKGGSEECYVYVRLERTGDLDSYVTYQLADGWYNLGGIDGVYYRLVEGSGVNKNYHVFENDRLTVRNNLTKEKMAQIDESSCKMVVTAYAIQTTGIESPSDGWYNLLTELEG